MNPREMVLWQDEWILVVNKPPGILSIPDGYDRALPHMLGLLCPAYGQLWIVHRLDKDTSGAFVLARDPQTHRCLNEQFQERRVQKTYHAIVRGSPPWTEIEVDRPLLVNGGRSHKTVVDPQKGKPAVTQFKVIERYHGYALVEAHPRTGYTHQIRAHLACTGFPIAADPLYGDGKPILLSGLKSNFKQSASTERPLLERTGLHAFCIQFLHPVTGITSEFQAPYPKDLSTTVKQLQKTC